MLCSTWMAANHCRSSLRRRQRRCRSSPPPAARIRCFDASSSHTVFHPAAQHPQHPIPMSSKFLATRNSLNALPLSNADIAALNSLQREWEQHSQRMDLLEADRILADQKAAYNAFLDEPTAENEQRLA